MLLNKLIYGNTYCAIEHNNIEGKDSFNVLQLLHKKGTLEILSSDSFKNIKDVFATLKKEQHVFIVLNNDKVLSKKVDGKFEELNKAVAIAFPNIITSDFHIEVSLQKHHSFISICRNADIESILDIYKKNNINVIGYSLGNNILSNTINYFSDQTTIYTSNAIISLDETNNMSKVENTNTLNTINEDYNINGLKVNSSEILNFSGIISYYSNTNLNKNNYSDTINQLKETFRQKRIFSNSLKFGLGFILLGLLINFLFFTLYRNNVNSLTSELQVSERSKETLMTLTSEVSRKRNIVSDITSLTNSKVSFYLDEIGNIVPKTISLTNLYFQPTLKRLKQGEEILLETNRILVSGESNNSKDFSDWIDELQKNDWIDTVLYKEYGVGKKSKVAFEIVITLQ